MARGARQTALNTAQGGINSSNALNTQLEGQNQQQNNYLQTQYKNMLANPGYDQATKNAIVGNATGSVAATYGGAADQEARSAARTGNAASLTAGQDQLAQEKANSMSQANNTAQVEIANDAQQQQQQALQGMSGLYGMNTNLLAKSLGIPVEYLQQYNTANSSAMGPGLLDSVIKGGASVGAAALA